MADASFFRRLRNRFLGTKKTNIAAPVAAAPAAIQKNNRSITQKIKNRLFGKPAPVAAPAPTPVAAAATTGYEELIESIRHTQESQLEQENKKLINDLYTALKKSIDKIIEKRGELIQKKEEQGQHIEMIERRINEESQRSENNAISIANLIRARKLIINGSYLLQERSGYKIFNIRFPIYLKNIDELIKFLHEDIDGKKRINYLGDNEADPEIINDIKAKVDAFVLTDDSNTIRQEMNEAITLFNTNFDFLEELKKIKRIRNKMYDMNESLNSEGIYYSYRESKIHDFRKIYKSTTIEEHKNKIREVLRAVTTKDKDGKDIREYNDDDIKFFLERRGQYDDVEEMIYIDHTKLEILEKLLKIANYMGGFYDFKIYGISTKDDNGNIKVGSPEFSKRSNDAINKVVDRYISKSSIPEESIALDFRNTRSALQLAMRAQKKTITKNDENKEVFKSIIDKYKNLTPYRLTELLHDTLSKKDINTIYDDIEQEDMNQVNKKEDARKEIDTIGKTLEFMKKYNDYLKLDRLIFDEVIKDTPIGEKPNTDKYIQKLQRDIEEDNNKIETNEIEIAELNDKIANPDHIPIIKALQEEVNRLENFKKKYPSDVLIKKIAEGKKELARKISEIIPKIQENIKEREKDIREIEKTRGEKIKKQESFQKKLTDLEQLKQYNDIFKARLAKERLLNAQLWPSSFDDAKTFIEQYKDIANTDPKYFILERAKGMIQNAEAKRIREAMNAQSRQNNAGKAKWLKEIQNALDNEGEDNKCLLAPGKRPGLRDESFDDAYKRLLVFLYHKMKQIPIDPPDKYQLNPDEEKELINSIRQFGHEHDLEKMAQDLFHTDLHELSRQIHFFEFNDPTRPPSTDPNKHKRILDKGKQSQRCSLSVAGGFPRAISIIKSHGRKLNYKAAYSTHICEDLSKDCVTIVNDKEFYDNELPVEGKTKSYIVVDPEYFPENSSIPINIIYSHLPIVSFIIDAFLNNAIIEIEDKLEVRMRQDYPELFALSVTTEEAEQMVKIARAKVEKTMKNRESIWFTNRNKSIRQKAVESAIQELDRAKARVEITKARTQIKTNLAIKARNLGSRAAARASIEKNIRNMNQEQTKKGLPKRKKLEYPRRAPPALNFKDPFVFGPEAPPAVSVAPPRPKGPRPSSASTPGLPGGPVASTRKLKPFTIPAPADRKLPSLADIRLPPKPQWVLNARSRVPGASTPGGPAAASTPELPGGPVAPPRVPNPNNVKKAAADARRALIERNYSNINKNQNKRKALLRSERVKFPRTAPPEPNHLKKAAEVKARAAAGLLPIGLPPKPQWVKNARSGASTHGGPAVVKATFPGLGPGWEEHNNNNWDDGEGPESSKVHEISAVPLVPGAPVIAPGPEAPVASVSGAPAPGLAPPAPGLAPLAPEAPAPAPEQPTAVSRNELYESTKKRIGTIRNKFKEAKATINAFKARPKGKAQAKGGRRTRKLKSRR